jgi:outer membrane protein TolC
MKKSILYIALLFALNIAIGAQEVVVPEANQLAIPPLSVVIESALHHSPLLKAKAEEIKIIDQELTIEKKKWMDHIFIEGATNYGLFDQVVISGQTSEGVFNTGLLSKSEQIRYYGGFSIKLPLSSGTSRRNKLEIKRLSKEKTNYELLQIKEEFIQIIIEEYYRLIYFEESMNALHEVFQTLNISYIKTKKEVENGRIELDDFALLVSTTGKSKDDYMKAKNNFYSQYYKMQNLTGITFEF